MGEVLSPELPPVKNAGCAETRVPEITSYRQNSLSHSPINRHPGESRDPLNKRNAGSGARVEGIFPRGKNLMGPGFRRDDGVEYCSTTCSIAPKIDRPLRSSISIRTRSPKWRKGVVGLLERIVSIMRSSAMQE